MGKVFASVFICFLGAISAGAATAQDRPIDFSSKGANVFNAPGGQSLTLPSPAAAPAVVADFLRGQGYLETTVGSLVTTSEGRSARTGITHLRFTQEVEGLTVYGTYVKAAVNDDGELVHLIENLATPPAAGLLPTALGARAALDAALDEVHPGVTLTLAPGPRDGNTLRFSGDDFFYRDPTVTRVAIPMQSGVLQEGYLVETWSEEGNLLHHTLIGGGGRVLQVELRTNNDSYNIFPDQPDVSLQTEVPGPGAANAESPAGWLFSGGQTTVNIGGNNANAYLDTDHDNAPDPGSSTVTNGHFLTPADLTEQPNMALNQEVAVQNLFYFNNVIHDKLYRHGFNEAAGNFQEDNFGKGGVGADPVNAEAQDGSGLNNANFATPLSDGGSPRMQMFLWSGIGDHLVETWDGSTLSTYSAMGADFGPVLSDTGDSGDVVVVNDGTGGVGNPTDACEPVNNNLTGKIALIDRGDCYFIVKAENAEVAGAIGVIMVNNVGDGILTMGDGGITTIIGISSVFIDQGDGEAIKTVLTGGGTVTATIKANPTPLKRDGDLDSDIIWHEYGHGLTWRMIGGMGSSMSGAIGEGMSDALGILINNDDIVGEYSTQKSNGIRSRPYTGYSSYRTYDDFSSGLGVHRNGEIYAAAIWRVWELFDLAGISQDTLFDYLIDGMNYTASGPAMEDMRDGILQSAAGSGNECLIWEGFAELGIGFGAEGTSTSVVTESFAVLPACADGNTAPVALPDSMTANRAVAQTTLEFEVTSVLDNDNDVDGESLTAVLVIGPSYGTLTLNTNGTFSYTPNALAPDSDSFTYKANDGAADSNVTTVTIYIIGELPTALHIGDLDGAVSGSGKNWQANVTVTVRDNDDRLVDGAQVFGDWTGGVSVSKNCTTVNGTCVVTSDNIPKKQTNAVFTVDKIMLSLLYDPTANVDPDGDSSGTAIQVNKDGTTQDPGALPNQPPSAGFSYTIDTPALTASFTDQSSDSDGTIVSWSWTFDDVINNTSTDPNPSHAYGAAGMYSVSLTVTDDDGGTNTDTQTVPVGVIMETMHIGDLDNDSSLGNKGGRWKARVIVTVHDSNEIAVPGATVSGSWSAGANGGASCDTDTFGQCTLVKQNVKGNATTVTLSITGVTHSSLTYGGVNHDPDIPVDSTGTVITVSKP